MSELRPAIFLDRDGTLIEDKDYLHKPEEVVFFAGAAEALAKAIKAGFLLVMITNQSGVGRGYFTLDDVTKVHEFIAAELLKRQVRFEKIYIAPEAPDEASRGRKPSPAFVLDAQKDFNINLGGSYMVGDKLIDLQCGWNAGVRRCLLVRTGYGARVEQNEGAKLRDAVVVDDICEAISWILEDSTKKD